MATPLTRNQKFDWDSQDINKLKIEYYEIGVGEFIKKYKTGRQAVYLRLGHIPDDLKKKKLGTRKN